MEYADDLIEFREWIRTAEPGSRICYATTQCLARDTAIGPVAAEAMREWYAGTVDLAQKRTTPRDVDPGVFDYIAIKRRRVVPRPQLEERYGLVVC